MLNILMPLDASVPFPESELLPLGQLPPLQNVLPLAPGTALPLPSRGRLILVEVGAALESSLKLEAGAQLREGFPDSGHSEWIAPDSPESLMGSLLALNAHLLYYEQRQRAS